MNSTTYAPRQQKSWKKTLLRITMYFFLLLLLLIPSYIAIATWTVQKNAPVNTTHAVYDSLIMTGPDSHRTNASATINNSLFSIFATLSESGVEVISVPDSHRAGHYTVSMNNSSVTDPYDFYFQLGSATCYYTTPDNKIFRTEHAQTTAFLNSSFAFELYDAATLPVLTTAATDEVLPSTLTWYYRTDNGLFTERLQKDLSLQTATYPIANDIAFYFSVQPSSHEILIRRGDELLYRGPSEGISLPLSGDELLDFEIVAVFDQNSKLDYYGQISYRFRMQVVEAARFSLSDDTPNMGDMLLLRCQNVKNAGKLQITAEPALAAAPIVFQRGEYVYAAFCTSTVGAHTLRVTYGTVAATFQLDVKQANGKQHTFPDDDPLTGQIDAITSALAALIAEGGATKDSALTPQSGFRLPQGSAILSFADTVSLANDTLTDPLPFGLYRASDAVGALCAGRVTAVGTDEVLGQYVIVDHGCGIYTYYAGLCETRVGVGDIVAVGDTVGLADTRLCTERSVLIAASIGKAAVSVNFLCSDPAPKA